MSWLRRDPKFRLQASTEELALSNYLTIYDLLCILDKPTARAVAKRIRHQAITIDSIMETSQENITRDGVETVRRLLLEACR